MVPQNISPFFIEKRYYTCYLTSCIQTLELPVFLAFSAFSIVCMHEEMIYTRPPGSTKGTVYKSIFVKINFVHYR